MMVGGYFWWAKGGIALISRLRERGDGYAEGRKTFSPRPQPSARFLPL